jgi:rhodanese-related sulfurtransferase
MMTRFNAKIGAAALVGSGALYLVLALATGHSAASEPPPDLSAREAGLDVWRTLALMAGPKGSAAIVDVRDRDDFERYHVPGARSAPGAGPSELVRQGLGRQHVVVVAHKDAQAAKLVGGARATAGKGAATRYHFLKDGARAWYLTLTLPVALFSDKAPPHGYGRSLDRVQRWLASQGPPADRAALRRSIERLAAANFQPEQLGSKKKPKASGKKKKISGGCG